MRCISHSITIISFSLSLFHPVSPSLYLQGVRVCVYVVCVSAWMSHHWCRRSSIFLKFAQISSSYSQCSRRTLNYDMHTLVGTYNWLLLCLYWDLTLTKTFLHFHILNKALFSIVIQTFSWLFQFYFVWRMWATTETNPYQHQHKKCTCIVIKIYLKIISDMKIDIWNAVVTPTQTYGHLMTVLLSRMSAWNQIYFVNVCLSRVAM